MFKLINRRRVPPLEPLLFNQDLSRSNIGALFKGARGRRPSFTTVMRESHFSTYKPWFDAGGKTSGQNTMYGLLPPRLLYEHVPSHKPLIRVHPNDFLLTQQISCHRMFIRYLTVFVFFYRQFVSHSVINEQLYNYLTEIELGLLVQQPPSFCILTKWIFFCLLQRKVTQGGICFANCA